jgi:undecaprenyl-diphosphatase
MKEFVHNIIDYFAELKEVGLAILAFIESSVFPIPPDLLLIAMSLSLPQKALLFALICTIFSTLGGAFGYAIGKFGGRPVFNWLFKKKAHYLEKVEKLYEKHGSWAVLGAAFTPIPYKVFTIASGIFRMNIVSFIIMSFIGRGARFFIVAICLMLFGETIKAYLELVIIAVTALIVIFFLVLYKTRRKIHHENIKGIIHNES